MAPIFWSESTFCFESTEGFVDSFSVDVGCKYREKIQHLRIKTCHRAEREPTLSSMWTTLLACKNLRTLEIVPQLFQQIAIARLFTSHSHLESICCFDVRHISGIYDPTLTLGNNVLLCEVSRSYPPQLARSVTEAELVEFSRRAWRIWLGLQPVLLHTSSRSFNRRNTCPVRRLKPGFDETTPSILYRFTDNSKPLIATIYGLPHSRSTFAAHVKERKAYMRRWKAAGYPATEGNTTPPVVQAKEARKEREENSRQKQLHFEQTMREKGIKIKKPKLDPQPEDPREKKRRAKLQAQWRSRIRRADRLMKYELLKVDEGEGMCTVGK